MLHIVHDLVVIGLGGGFLHGAAGIQPGFDLFKAFQQGAVGHRFHQVIRHAVLQRRAEVFVIAVAAEKYFLDVGVFHQPMAQLQAVHIRHFNIGQHHIHRVFGNILQGFACAGEHLHHLEPNVLPGEQLGHSAGNLLFIINNNQFIHLAAPIRVQGKTVLSACPYTGADYYSYTSIKPFCPKGKTKITE